MTATLEHIALAVPDVVTARSFYGSVFSSAAADRGEEVAVDLHGTGLLTLRAGEDLAGEAHAYAPPAGFRGFSFSYVLSQPSEVTGLLETAVQNGATILKPAKKSMFAGFSGVYRAPDGAIWKLASESKKDTGPAGDPPRPLESGLILGVAEPKRSTAFYNALGMTVDRDYGNKYIDFRPTPGRSRLCLMGRAALASDVGVNEHGSGFGGIVLQRTAGSPADVDSLVAAALSAGGRLIEDAHTTTSGRYGAYVANPDQFVWKVAVADHAGPPLSA